MGKGSASATFEREGTVKKLINTEAHVISEIEHLNDAVLHKPFLLNSQHFPVLFVVCMFSS